MSRRARWGPPLRSEPLSALILGQGPDSTCHRRVPRARSCGRLPDYKRTWARDAVRQVKWPFPCTWLLAGRNLTLLTAGERRTRRTSGRVLKDPLSRMRAPFHSQWDKVHLWNTDPSTWPPTSPASTRGVATAIDHGEAVTVQVIV